MTEPAVISVLAYRTCPGKAGADYSLIHVILYTASAVSSIPIDNFSLSAEGSSYYAGVRNALNCAFRENMIHGTRHPVDKVVVTDIRSCPLSALTFTVTAPLSFV